ncbi:Co2+/Mg2+ efflux protein ApaG [Polluticoccus soli]|uniref:Co2+/Mg2+ efflux protein ApaG n=1 Tax=Polluticoccus soli TaxID=3034150 RepID=UPI0023E30832|nr:Co2+/Mg2+ efflux protein ApaG [Flavipsychrobacter sp. JY13-12]
MVQQVTEGVSITVETFYQPAQSNPVGSEFLFAYRITIENLSDVPVKLLRRHWYIYDSNGSFREVEGEGVVGQQPIIESGQSYQYVSAANLRSEIGKMYGNYQMENLYNKKLITVAIPEFQLMAPFKLN